MQIASSPLRPYGKRLIILVALLCGAGVAFGVRRARSSCPTHHDETESPAVATPAPHLELPSAEIAMLHIRCKQDGCTIPRESLDRILSHPSLLDSRVRFVPWLRDGKSNGVKLYALRADSVLAALGMRNGDVLLSLNGVELTRPIDALATSFDRHGMHHIVIGIERQDRPMMIEVEVL